MPMSNKPAKHSDRKKQWRSGERRGRRVVPVQMTRHLIVCEGRKTEPAYFDALKRALGEANGRKVDIKAVGTGLHTLDLVEEAQRICAQAPDTYAHVWISYDKDDFPEEEFDEVVGLCERMGGAATYHAMWSNPCFELWLLLHFGHTTAPMMTSECLGRVDGEWRKAFGRPYEKSNAGVFDALRSRLDDARANAKKLADHHARLGNDRPSGRNPGTAVVDLLDEIAEFLG